MDECTCDVFCDSPCPEHATEEAKAAWDGGMGDLSEDKPATPFSPAEVLANDRFALWRSNIDARAVQVALMLSTDEFDAWMAGNVLPSDYLTRKRQDDHSKCAGVGKLQGDLVPDLRKPLTVESLVVQYEAHAKRIHEYMGWDAAQWRGLAELWAVTDLEILRMVEEAQPHLTRLEVACKLFNKLPEERIVYDRALLYSDIAALKGAISGDKDCG